MGCLCDGKEGVEARPLCEEGIWDFGSPLFLGCSGEVIVSPFFGQNWVLGVETGHRWSLEGRDLGPAEGRYIDALVACMWLSVIEKPRGGVLQRFRSSMVKMVQEVWPCS